MAAGVAEALARLTRPINDALAVAGLKPGSWAGPTTRGDLLAAMGRERMTFWAWDRARWARTVAAGNVDVRQLLIAVAYQLCGINDLHWEIRGFKMRLFCQRVFGHAAVEETVGRVQSHLDTLGYAAQLRRPNLQRALYELMLAARSPLLEDLAERPELLREIRDRTSHNPGRSGIEQLTRTLVEWPGKYFAPAVRKVAEEWPDEHADIVGATPYSPRRGMISLRIGAGEDRQAIAKQCGTSVEMLERSYSFAIEDLEDEGPKPAEEERLRARQLALAAHQRRQLRVA